jgi:hypothetical protein
MPTYKDITVTMHTPFTIEGIPEIAPPAPTALSTSPIKQLVNESRRCVSVYVPVMPQSLFWLSYAITDPPTDGTFFVFKLFVNRQEIVTWSCDKDQKWKGKTMFGLFDTGLDDMVVGGAGMEKRVFKFGSPGQEDWRVVGDLRADGEKHRFVEVRVCRANMKMRTPRVMDKYKGFQGSDISMPSAGFTSRGDHRSFYKFGLVDAQDNPYARFRFYYRTWGKFCHVLPRYKMLPIPQKRLMAYVSGWARSTRRTPNQFSPNELLILAVSHEDLKLLSSQQLQLPTSPGQIDTAFQRSTSETTETA